MKKLYRKTAILLALMMFLCTGCGKQEELAVAVTWGLAKDELFQLNGESLTVPEAKILLTTQMAGYRNLYGEAVLTRQFGERTLEETIKENTLSLLGKIMVMNQMAEKYQIRLTEEELNQTQLAAEEYVSELSNEERELLDAEEKDAQALFEKILLADKVFEELTGEQEIEISDDEARVVTIRHIMIKTVKTDENGMHQPLGSLEKQEAYTKSLEIFDRLLQGADFDSMSELYNEDIRSEYSVGRGDLTQVLEDAVFSMETGETSIVLESAAGYHIIRCVNNFDREATEQNKSKIVAQRKWDAFEETYNAFAAELKCEFSDKRWDEIQIRGNDSGSGRFLEIYRTYFTDKTE